MASLRIQPFSPEISSHISNPTSTIPLISNHNPNPNHKKLRSARISCTNRISDAVLASELASKVSKINSDLLRTEEAMKKSRKMLFGEFCEYLGLKEEDEAKRKWRKMDEDEKWASIKGFVTEWGTNFHPLSARSAKEMVEEYVTQENNDSSPANSTSGSMLFPGLKRIMGFTQNN